MPIDHIKGSLEPDEPVREAATASSRAGIEQLFKDYNESLIRFLNARLRSTQEAHEVAQEAYVQLLGLNHRSTISFLQAYLFRTAANLATNRLKQRSRRQRIDGLVFFEEDAAPSPERQCAARQELQIISRALEHLPPKCAMAFMLAKFEELEVDEVAEVMGLTARQVRRYLARALEYCHEALSQGALR